METVNHPKHYTQGASTIAQDILLVLGIEADEFSLECIEVIEQHRFGFHLGNAVKYLWRCGQKGNQKEDLQKSLWYLERYVYWNSTRFWFLRLIPGYFNRIKVAIGMIVDKIEASES